jgi:hypothetical protein
MPSTYEPIISYTVPSSTSTFTISSIPQTYTDLVIIGRFITNTTTGSGVFVRPNGGVNYCVHAQMQSSGGTLGSGSVSTANQFTGFYHEIPGTGDASGGFTTVRYNIQNYTSSINKQVQYDRFFYNLTTSYIAYVPTTSPITSFEWFSQNQPFGAGCTVELYGIKKA